MLDDQSYELIANSSLMLNKWSHIIWHSIVSADSINLGIIINGQLINEQSYNINPTGYVIYNAPITIGYRSNDTLSSYRGELYSANIKNYFFLNDYINSSPSFDGSAYCGIPNYFDYSAQIRTIPDKFDYFILCYRSHVFVAFSNICVTSVAL